METVKDFLRSKNIFEGAYMADMSAPEKYFKLVDLLNDYTQRQVSVKPEVKLETSDDSNKIRWFMELALKMRETGYSDASIYSIDIDGWDEYRVDEKLTPEQAITEEGSNG